MRKLFVLLFVLVVGFLGLAASNPSGLKNPQKLLVYSPCDTPISYKIDSIDSRFGVTQEQLLEDVVQASEIWSNAYGKPLFVYAPSDGKLSINMTYDTRQALNQEIGELEGKLDADKATVESKIAEFESRSVEFKRRVEDLNSQIDYWNAKGGAPKEEYEKLKAQQAALKQEAADLNEMAKTLNRSTAAFNSQVSELNQTVTTFNQALAERPEQGLYRSLEERIDIYITNSNLELIHTIAHEMGHALAMEHVEDKNSIMYTSTNQVLMPSESDIDELEYACRERSILQKYRAKLQELVYRYQAADKTSN